MPKATVPKKLFVNRATRKVGRAARRKVLSGFRKSVSAPDGSLRRKREGGEDGRRYHFKPAHEGGMQGPAGEHQERKHAGHVRYRRHPEDEPDLVQRKKVSHARFPLPFG